MEKTIRVLDRLIAHGVIRRYAIAGAHAALNYIEPSLTRDIDILVSLDTLERKPSGLLTLEPILDALRKAGFDKFEAEGIVIDDWPVQFLPVADDLESEALEQAQSIHIHVPGEQPVAAPVLSAEHLVAIAIRVGRPKDWGRVHEFLTQGAVDLARLKAVLLRHRLMDKWRDFCVKTRIADPFD